MVSMEDAIGIMETLSQGAIQAQQVQNQSVTLLDLPDELIYTILSELPAGSIFSVVQTCHRLEKIGKDDGLWRLKVQAHIPYPLPRQVPARSITKHHSMPKCIRSGSVTSWYQLYKGFAHYWFLLDVRLWMSDRWPAGDLVLSLFDLDSLQILGYRLTAQDPHALVRQSLAWERDQDVRLFSFWPVLSRQRLMFRVTHPGPFILDDSSSSKVKLVQADDGDDDDDESPSQEKIYLPPEFCSVENQARILLARNIPDEAIGPTTEVWPPRLLPAIGRVRNPRRLATAIDDDGNTPYTTASYTPWRTKDRSTSAFRLFPSTNITQPLADPLDRLLQWRQYGWSSNSICTYGAVWSLAATPEFPLTGVWMGDYNGHGTEFIAVLPLDLADPTAIPDMALQALSTADWYYRFLGLQSEAHKASMLGKTSMTGLYGVKITGDRNVPHGQYSFIVPSLDLLLREAEEKPFTGARVVGALGHAAQGGFLQGKFDSWLQPRVYV